LGKNKKFNMEALEPEVKEWLDAVTEREIVRRDYWRIMRTFMAYTGWTPKQMLEIKRQGLKEGRVKTELETKIIQFLRDLQQAKRKTGKAYAPGTVVKARTALGSFLSYHGFQLPRKFIRLSQASAKMIRVPEQSEIEAMIQYTSSIELKALFVLAAEFPARPRVFMALEWSWLEPGWEEKDIAHIRLPPNFYPTEPGPKKFEPMGYIGRRGISILKQLKAKIGKPEGRIFPYTPEWFLVMPARVYRRAVEAQAIRPSNADEQPITLKSFRKYGFNALDAAKDISPEWRKMFKGRELGVEKFYSKEYIEKLREAYRSAIYPLVWKQEVTVDEKKLQLDAARRILMASGIDPDQVLRTMPHLTTVEEQLKLLDDLIRQQGLRHRPDGGVAITAEDKQGLVCLARLLKKFAALP